MLAVPNGTETASCSTEVGEKVKPSAILLGTLAGNAGPRRATHMARRARILTETRNLIAERGAEGVTLRELASRSGKASQRAIHRQAFEDFAKELKNIAPERELWRGEWFLDTEFGTPYLDGVLGKQLSLSGAVAALKQSILEVNDVNAITNFTYQFNRQTRQLDVQFECQTNQGLVTI